jgi:hypothetical protein
MNLKKKKIQLNDERMIKVLDISHQVFLAKEARVNQHPHWYLDLL